uniref:D-aspartate oxidase n=1 Tax=Neogobius melanostomus TaxID=47308 RepID=A0A8C6THN8_9GOBI
MKRVKVVVVGAGVIGFSTAVCVAESLPSCSVTLVAEKFSPDTTSDGAAGILFAAEFPDIPLQRQRRWFKDSFDHLLSIAQSAEAPRAGVMLSSGCQVFKEVPAVRRPFWSDLVIGFREMSEREMRRFPERTFGQAFTTLKCECASYLPWLHSRSVIYMNQRAAFLSTNLLHNDHKDSKLSLMLKGAIHGIKDWSVFQQGHFGILFCFILI